MLKLFHTYYPIRNLLFFLGEGGLIFLALIIGIMVRFDGVIPVEEVRHSIWVRAFAITLVVQISLYYHDLYEVKSPHRMTELGIRIVQAIGVACIILAALYFVYPPMIIEQGVFFIGLFFLLFFLVSWRLVYQYVCKQSLFTERIMLIGSGNLAASIADEIQNNFDSGYRIHAVIDPSDAAGLANRIGANNCNDYEEMADNAIAMGIGKIVVALDQRRGSFPVKELLRCKMHGINVLDGVTFYEGLSGRILVKKTPPSWLIFSEGFHRQKWVLWTKRLVDLLISGIILLIFWPVMLITAIAIKLGSRGPVFFSQVRTGYHNRDFTMVKFRTMVENAEALTGPVWAEEDDPRITRVGNFLRKTRLDELPQLWNVLKGEMSFVGPRPERPKFVEQLAQKLPYYGERHSVKPGLTGWAQVRYGYGASELDALNKLEYDLFYVKHLSLALDFYIVLKTVEIVMFGRGR